MVTKPTGRPPGRPRKPRTGKPPRHKPGQPEKPLAGDPGRYQYALLQAAFSRGRAAGYGEPRVAENFAETPENLAAMRRGERYQVYTITYRGNEKSPRWRDQNAFRPIADDLARRLRRARKDPATDADARWLANMSWAWVICLERHVDLEGLAEFLADDVGEREYFDAWMRPLLQEP